MYFNPSLVSTIRFLFPYQTNNEFMNCLADYEPGLKDYRAKIFKMSMGARNRRGIGLSYRPARLHRLAELIPWNQFPGPINI
jgi:hypothetical protein